MRAFDVGTDKLFKLFLSRWSKWMEERIFSDMASLEKAMSLMAVHRHEDAVAELHRLLAREPEFSPAHYQLALAYSAMPDAGEKALEAIDRAIALDADDADYLATKALILCDLDRAKEGLKVAEEALSLDPGSFQWYAKASALMGLRKWRDALTACECAQELDPDYDAALNLRTLLVRVTGNLEAAESGSLEQLSRRPEDPVALSNAGWTYLERGERAKAEELFREALRIDPNDEYARDGLLQAFKSRSLFYRVYLKWVFLLQRMEGKSQWLLIIGLYLGYRVGRAALDQIHPVLGGVVVLAYLLLVFGTFLAPGIGNGLLLKDRLARLALTAREKWDGLLVAGLFFGGMALAALGFALALDFLIFLGCGMLVGAIPSSLVARNLSKTGQLLFSGVVALALLGAIHSWMGYQQGGELISDLGLMAVVSAALSTWLSSVDSLVKLS